MSLPPHSIDRLDTGISGLDNILSGGLPSGQMYLLEGEPGTGKTTLAMQFIRAGFLRGERVLYVTLSEPRSELQGSILSHGWSVDEIPIAEFVPSEANLSPEDQYTVFHPSEIELASTVQRLTEEIDRIKPDRLVIDSLSELSLLADNAMRYRRQLLAFKQFFSGRKTTVLLLDDCSAQGNDLQLRSIAHGVIRMSKIPRSFGVTRRQMEIIKLRGTAFREGFHDYNIRYGGVIVYPRLIASEHSEDFSSERLPSGIAEFDAMLGGGLARGSTTLFTGPTGVGKSSIAMQFACSAARRGDRAIVYAFDEVLRIAKARATALGLDVDQQMAAGNLAMTQVDPAELSPGEFIWQIVSDVEEKNARVVIIDSLNGFLNSMPGEQDLILHLHELSAYLNQKGVTTIIVLTQHGLVGAMHADVDITYLADSVILLRYFECQGEIRQVISILKQRTGAHERALREFCMTPNGLEVGAPLTNFTGILTGIPDYKPNSPNAAEPFTSGLAG